METTTTKSGYKTTEFWGAQVLNLLLIVLAVAASRGAIAPDDQAGVTDAVTQIVAAVAAVINQAIYIWGRVAVKRAAIENVPTSTPPLDGPIL